MSEIGYLARVAALSIVTVGEMDVPQEAYLADANAVWLPVQLTATVHRRLARWCRDTADLLEATAVARGDVLEALIDQLLSDPETSQAVRRRLEERTPEAVSGLSRLPHRHSRIPIPSARVDAQNDRGDPPVHRRQYLDDPHAPVAQGLLAAAFAVVCDHRGQVLLVRRADDGNWELPGGRIEVGESATAAAERETAEEAGVLIRVCGLAGVYSDPGHILAYPGEGIYQQLALCFHATALEEKNPQPDHDETTAARWFDPAASAALPMHPTMRERLRDALTNRGGDPHVD